MANLVRRLVNPGGIFGVRVAAAPTPAKSTKPVPSKDAPVGSRAWAAFLIQQYGEKQGAEFVNRELTPTEAHDEAVRIQHGETSEKPPAGGFASKVKIQGGLFNALRRKK